MKTKDIRDNHDRLRDIKRLILFRAALESLDIHGMSQIQMFLNAHGRDVHEGFPLFSISFQKKTFT